MLHVGDILYHGSYAAVERVDLGLCAPGKDFGRGFYLTSSHEQAVRFIPSSLRKAQATGAAARDQKYGFVSKFEVGDISALSCFEFAEANAAWLRFVALNRRASLAHELSNRLPRELHSADIIMGKIANDTTNRVITTYLNGLYGEIGSELADETAIRLLLPDRLKDQYCFRTKTSVATLTLVEVEKHDV